MFPDPLFLCLTFVENFYGDSWNDTLDFGKACTVGE